MDAIAWVEQGKQQLQWSLWTIALQSFERAIAIDENCLTAWDGKAEALRKLGKWNEVVEVDEKITSLRMVAVILDADFYFNQGNTFYQLSAYEEAIASYDKAIEFKPDGHAAWFNRGISLYALGRKEEAIASYEKAIEFKPDDYAAWFNRGNSLYALGRNEEAIASYEKAIEFKPDYDKAWANRGSSLGNLGRNEEAIASFDKAIEFKPDYDKTWYNRGNSLSALGRKEEAIASYEKAIEFKPDDHEAWTNRGLVLCDLGRNEEAIASYERAIEFKPDYDKAWANRGISLSALGRNEEAIASYEKAIEIKPDDGGAWHNRGSSLGNLGRNEEAIASYEKAIEFKPDYHEAWHNRGNAAVSSRSSSPYALPVILNQRPANLHHKHPELNQRGYDGQVASLTVGLTYCPADSHPLGHGFLQRSLDNAYSDRAKLQRFPRPDYFKALKAYEASLTVLTVTDHPEERLQTLQRLVRVHFALKTNAETIAALIRQGAELRDRILTQAQSQPQRDRLHRTLPNFNELTVDLHLRQGETIRAIETAEADKNGLMQWLLPTTETPTYSQMQDWIGDRTVVYWHFSAIALTTFILNAECDRPIVLHHTNPETALKQRNELETWIDNWNTSYNTHLNQTKKSENTPAEISEWRNSLETQLQTLAEILDIPTLSSHLDPNRALTLIPHRDLHRLPLPSFFPDFLVTTLPSIQLGRNLRPTQSLHDGNLLNLPAPTHQDTAPLPEASLESIALDRLFQTHSIPVHTIANCNLPHLQTALPQNHTHLHFNGHAYYNDQNPKQSALALQDTDRLTVENLRSIDLQHYRLITLASCETALTGNQTITAEYVGLVSALLSHRIPHILSTLWTVQSNASTLLILQFYRQLLKGNSPTQSLRHSQHWLQTLTNRKLDRLYRTVLSNITSKTAPTSAESRIEAFLESECDELGRMETHQKPYQDPYFWAAFILAGRH